MFRDLALSDSIESMPRLLSLESVMLFRRYVLILFRVEKLLYNFFFWALWVGGQPSHLGGQLPPRRDATARPRTLCTGTFTLHSLLAANMHSFLDDVESLTVTECHRNVSESRRE